MRIMSTDLEMMTKRWRFSDKGVQESESRTGTRLVSPGHRPWKKKSDPSTKSFWNMFLKVLTQISNIYSLLNTTYSYRRWKVVNLRWNKWLAYLIRIKTPLKNAINASQCCQLALLTQSEMGIHAWFRLCCPPSPPLHQIWTFPPQ
jgi:hypothetical protein